MTCSPPVEELAAHSKVAVSAMHTCMSHVVGPWDTANPLAPPQECAFHAHAYFLTRLVAIIRLASPDGLCGRLAGSNLWCVTSMPPLAFFFKAVCALKAPVC